MCFKGIKWKGFTRMKIQWLLNNQGHIKQRPREGEKSVATSEQHINTLHCSPRIYFGHVESSASGATCLQTQLGSKGSKIPISNSQKELVPIKHWSLWGWGGLNRKKRKWFEGNKSPALGRFTKFILPKHEDEEGAGERGVRGTGLINTMKTAAKKCSVFGVAHSSLL